MAFQQIKAKPINEKVFLSSLIKATKEEIDESDNEFKKTYQSFKDKPSFRKKVTSSSKKIEGTTLTSSEGSKNNPYPFVTRGTSVRYATMSPDFSAKTKKRVIGSGGGRGGVLYVDKRRPRPGIEAREFEEAIAEQEQPKFEKRGQEALNVAAKKSGHKI